MGELDDITLTRVKCCTTQAVLGHFHVYFVVFGFFFSFEHNSPSTVPVQRNVADLEMLRK